MSTTRTGNQQMGAQPGRVRAQLRAMPVETADPSQAERVRTLVAAGTAAAVSTVGASLQSYPFASVAHPGAYWLDFGDFDLYRLEIAAVRFIRGFAPMGWVDAEAEATAARVLAVDRYGYEPTVETGNGPCSAHVAFRQPLDAPHQARQATVAIVQATHNQEVAQ